MTERSTALFHGSWCGLAWVRIPLETYIFILNFSILACSQQLSGSHANEIKHDHSPVIIKIRLIALGLYICSCSIALMKVIKVKCFRFIHYCMHTKVSTLRVCDIVLRGQIKNNSEIFNRAFV